MNTFVNNQTIKIAVTSAQKDALRFIETHGRYFGFSGTCSYKSCRATITKPVEMRSALLILGESNRCVVRNLIKLIDAALAPYYRKVDEVSTQNRIAALIEGVDAEIAALKASDFSTSTSYTTRPEVSLDSASDLSIDTLTALYK